MAPSLSKNVLDSLGLLDGELTLSIILKESNFLANGHPILSEVPTNIVATLSPFNATDKAESAPGCFVGFDVDKPKSWHVVPIGKLRGIRFLSLFRFKVWWTTHWVGNNGKDLEHGTQMLILDKNDLGRPHVLLLPILEGPFKASLQPGVDDYVDMCLESGSSHVCGSSFRSCLYIHVGNDPYQLLKEAMKVVRLHLRTFKLLEEKTPPEIVDKFGWCTWDAFYLNVHPEGVREGVKGLVEGGCPPGLVLIDDGWQSTCHDEDPITDQEVMNRTSAGGQMPCRLIKFEENYKFRDYKSPNEPAKKVMSAFVRDLKTEFKSIENVYVWHALCGYWGSVRPNIKGMPESRLVAPKLSKGLLMTMEDLAVDKIVDSKIGLVPPEQAHEMYEGLHSHLESAAIDGVKVDVIHVSSRNLSLIIINSIS